MARIQWLGVTISATPIEQQADGTWLMTANEHGPRFANGSVIRVKPAQILEMAAAEMPEPAASAAALQVAMDAERKTLPTVAQVLAFGKEQAAQTPATPAKEIDMTSKLAQLAALAAKTNSDIEAQADQALSRLQAAKTKAQGGIDKLNSVTAEVEAGTSALEDFANQMGNGGPTVGKS